MDLASLFSVEGKTALVTGGSRGIGAVIAEALVRSGARVIISSRKAEVCDATAAELSRHGECRSVPADLSTPEGVEKLAAAVTERADRLDLLFNNAGATWGAPMEDFPVDGWDKVMATNVRAPFMLSAALMGTLRAAGTAEDPARIINIGSVDGMRVPATPNYPYSASKAAIHMLTRQMAHTVVGDHINVNAIAPGPFRSKMMSFVLDAEGGEEMVASSVPMGRIGTPDDMAGVALFLSSRASAYLTGAVIPVDGGISST